MNFKSLQDEVKRRSTLDQSGGNFDTAIKNTINFVINRIAKEHPWRSLRRDSTFDTKTSYTTGSGAGSFTNNSSSITIIGSTFLTDGIEIGRRIKLSGDGFYHTIKKITGETTLTIERNYTGTTTTSGTYEILPQEQYNLPIQSSHRLFLWHREWGYPFFMHYVPDQNFYKVGFQDSQTNIPIIYRMWGENTVITQPKNNSILTISSSSSSDTNIDVIVYGNVLGYPDFETITTNSSDGTTNVNSTKTFDSGSIDRIVCSESRSGRITITSDNSNTTVSVIPVGNTTDGIRYRKVQIWPLPTSIFPIRVKYYKIPYKLINDNDVHELGEDFDESIILLATAKLKSEQNQEEGKEFFALYRDEIRNLKKNNSEKIDYIPTLKPFSGKHGFTGSHPFLQDRQIGSYFGPIVNPRY